VKAAVIVMAVLVIALGALCWARGGATLFVQGLRAGSRGAATLVPLLAVVFLLAGFAEVLLPREAVSHWLGGQSGVRGYLLALVLGAVTPGGGPVGLPLAAALMRSGAGVGVLVTYLTSMSLLSFVRVPLEIGTYGLRLTVLRLLSSLVLPIAAGYTAQWLSRLAMSS